MRIAILPCTKTKFLESNVTARRLYSASFLFRLSYEYATKVWKADQVYIASALHGLIRDSQIIHWYDHSMKDKSPAERREWRQMVSEALVPAFIKKTTFLSLLPTDYRVEFPPGVCVETPCIKMRLGPKLVWLKKQLEGK